MAAIFGIKMTPMAKETYFFKYPPNSSINRVRREWSSRLIMRIVNRKFTSTIKSTIWC